ncbi:PH domain-containing protein [Sphingomonas sp. HF-S4]|uniref:PH domain-containing protein n=1 Tax=Sphingomonas agrestis TaxID=3080540 RepID=A0ABU3Y5T9_9SPHN|nr:PH domain-containing protein [Sphingomonas sp. HF-S4]MDV3456751.1 PH domain-containing protein [Sphingomonas sp. HF-S4]
MSEEAPRRVHPVTMLIGALKTGPSTLLMIPALYAAGTRFGLLVSAALILAGLATLAAIAWLNWWFATYRLTDDAFVIESGVLHRSRREIPLERVQDVSFEQKPLARLLGLALVKIETGGGGEDEAVLDSVTLAEAQRLRLALRRLPAAASEDEEPAGRTVFAMSPGRVLLQGLFGFSLVWIAGIFAVLQTVDQAIELDWRELFGAARSEVASHFTIGAALAVLAAALALGVVAGVGRTFVRDYGFRLDERGGRFRRIRGLLTRSEVVIVKDRVQLALVHRAPVRGRFGWHSLEMQTLGGSDDAGGRQAMAPFARAEEVARVVDAAGLPRFEADALTSVWRGHVLRCALRHGVPVLVVFAVAGFFVPLLWLGLALAPVPAGIALLQRRHHRYGLRATSLQVTRGVLSQRDWIVPYPAVQVVAVRRSWLQRRLGLATVLVDTAGGSGWARPDIADVAEPIAFEVAQALAICPASGSARASATA